MNSNALGNFYVWNENFIEKWKINDAANALYFIVKRARNNEGCDGKKYKGRNTGSTNNV
jgi:hypothetical protein